MGVYEKLGLQETMDRSGIEEQLSMMRKKLISRQNSANLEKRTEAERLLETVNVMDELIEAAGGQGGSSWGSRPMRFWQTVRRRPKG